MRLYRRSLKTLQSWAVDRHVFNEEATRIQGLFRANMAVSPGAATRLVREAEEQLFGLTHPVSVHACSNSSSSGGARPRGYLNPAGGPAHPAVFALGMSWHN